MNRVHLDLMDKSGIFFIEKKKKKIAYMTFRLTDDKQIMVDHTIVFPPNEGKGYAKMLMKEMLTFTQQNNLTLIPLCRFVKEQLVNFPEYNIMVEDIENE